MIHLIWSILNITTALYFIYLIVGFIVKGKRIFKAQFKVVSIFIMIIGIVQIISASNLEISTNRITITDDYNKNNTSEVKEIILEDNLTFDINLLVKYSVGENEYIPIESNSFLTGFVSGYSWECKTIKIGNYKSNQNTEFIAYGILKWNLFGINMYTESKKISGIIK